MNLMFIAPGRSIHSNNWAAAMCDRGHTVHFVTQESFTENQCSFVEKVDKRFIIHTLPFKGDKGFLLNAPAVKRLTKKINPDVIHVQQAAGYGLLGTYSDRSKTFVSVYGWEVYDLVKSKIWKPVIRYVLNWHKHIGSTSYCMRTQIYKEFPKIKIPVVVTPFGVDMKKFKHQPCEKDDIIVGTVKKMDRKYGIEYLIKAFNKSYGEIRNSSPDIAERLYLELVGPGNQTEELKELAAKLGISDRVRFIGKVPHIDVPKWLNRFDVYAAPSILDSESFGVAVIEASSCRKPVIVSDVGGLPEVVEDGKTGFIVPSGNVDKLSEKITQLIMDEKLRENMGIAGEKRVKELYDWEYCVDLMEKVYSSIVDGTYERDFSDK